MIDTSILEGYRKLLKEEQKDVKKPNRYTNKLRDDLGNEVSTNKPRPNYEMPPSIHVKKDTINGVPTFLVFEGFHRIDFPPEGQVCVCTAGRSGCDACLIYEQRPDGTGYMVITHFGPNANSKKHHIKLIESLSDPPPPGTTRHAVMLSATTAPEDAKKNRIYQVLTKWSGQKPLFHHHPLEGTEWRKVAHTDLYQIKSEIFNDPTNPHLHVTIPGTEFSHNFPFFPSQSPPHIPS